MSVESTIQGIIANAQSQADQAMDSATGYADSAQTVASTALSLLPLPNIVCPDVDLPPFDPNVDLSAEYERTHDEMEAEYGPAFATELTNYMDTYFPDVDGCLQSSIDTWICNSVTNGGSGLPAAVENAAWERGRDRLRAEEQAQVNGVFHSFASRGMSMPSGFMSAAQQEIRENAQRQLGEYDRDVTIKQVEMMLENTRFAIEQGVRLRIAALTAVQGYLQTWLNLKRLPIDYAKAYVDAKAQLWNTTSSYYNALVNVANLDLKCQEIEVDAQIRDNANLVNYLGNAVTARVEAAVASAKALADVAASAMGAQNTLASLAKSEDSS